MINNSDNNTRAIVCSDYFPLKGLTISSIGAVNDLRGTVSIGNQIKGFTSEDDFENHRVIKALGNTTVKGALSLGRGVSFQAGDASSSESLFLIEGNLSTVCGKIDVNVGAGSVKLDCSNHLENVRFTITGEYEATGSAFSLGRAVKAEFAQFDIDNGSISTTLEEAMKHSSRSSPILLRGDVSIDEEFKIPADVELVVLNSIKVATGKKLIVDGTLSLGYEEHVNIDGDTVPVYGRLILSDTSAIAINGVLSSRVKESSTNPNVYDANEDKLTISGAYYTIAGNNVRTIYVSSLSDAIDSIDPAVGRTIELRGAVSFMDNKNLPAGSRIHVAKGAELVVGGNLEAKTAGSKITLEGSIKVIDKGSIKTIEMLDGKLDAVMYKTEEGSATVYNYVSPDSASGGGGTEYEISGEVTISTPIKGDLKFIGKDGSGSTVTIKADVKSDSLILADVTVVIESGREISAILKDESGSTIEIRGKAGEGFSVSSNSGSMKISGKMQGDSELVVSSGITADGVTVSKMEVKSGGSIAFNGSSIVTTLSVTGTITVENGASLTSDFISIFGSLISHGSINVKRILVGVLESIIAPYSLTLGASPSVAGSVTASEYMVVGAGSDVSGVDIRSYRTTSYLVEGSEYVTVYAGASSATKIGVVCFDIDNAEWLGWYAGNRTSVDVSDSNVGDYSTVHAIIDYDIYSIAIAADKAVSKVFIDGGLMTRNSDGTWSASVAAGHHEVSVKLKAGYVGTGVLALQSGGPGDISVDGMGFEVHGDRSEFALTLSGFSWVGWVDPDPEPPIPFPVPTPTPSSSSDDGVTAADCLLVVLIGIVAIMSIVLAGRMLRR